MKRKRSSLRQLTFAVCIQGLDLEPLLRWATLEAMAAVLMRPSEGDAPAPEASLPIPLDSFRWPSVGAAEVHYPWGGHGARIEHPPGIVCDECQWQRAADGFPLSAHGRQPQRVCGGCRLLRARWAWGRGSDRCAECISGGASQASRPCFGQVTEPVRVAPA